MTKVLSFFMALPVLGTLLHFIITALLAGLLALTYGSLTQEKPIATLTFDRGSQGKIYVAHLYDADGSKIGDYDIYGDQWRIDAGFIKVKYWANLLGVDSKYTLNRLEGRYRNIRDENAQPHRAYQVESHSLIENLDFFFDTTYGASVYKNIRLNREFKVLKTPTGLMVRDYVSTLKSEKSLIERTKDLLR